ncbi:FimV family protein [Limnohabitans sp. T6-20]|uniref:type IV pilus assembly protein FimV n=1 Tax=Limnohabitans sp. T6-20 TaxID=1100725 RepID=UPI001304E795|nr:FimV/HubP family polar landmark protein [Limnohabitans sp. T6-20]
MRDRSVTQDATENMLRLNRFPQKNPALPRAWVVASLLACASLSVKALTLGQFSVESGLGEPLRAAIEITQYKVEDLRKLKVQLAEPASFEQAGMAFHPALQGLQTRLEFRGDGKPYIALTGQTPVNEHFVDVIVEAQWPSGRLAMNYTLLVSPVGALKVRTDKPQGDAAATTAVIAPVVSPQALAVTAAPAVDNTVRNAEDAITVRAGDTASKLVLRQMPAGVSLDQMLLAMVRANPEAFIEGNVNLLREGAPVHLPNAQEAAQISAEEARQTVIAQTADFVAYARRLAQSTLKATDTASREMTGKVATEAPTTVPVPTEQDKLTLSKREVTADSAEARLAVEREIQDKTEQLAALKKNLETLKSLSAQPGPEKTSLAEPSALKPSLPVAAAEAPSAPLLDTISRNPSIWAWVMALLAGMAGLVWVVRRRPAKPVDLFGTDSRLAPARQASPLPSGLPPQFAGLDLNLTPAADTTPGPQAPHTTGQSQ